MNLTSARPSRSAAIIATTTIISLFAALSASAANLNWSADTPVALTSPAIALNIASGSAASDLVVNDGSVVVTVPGAGHFSISSSDRQLIATGGSPATTCTSGTSTVNIDPAGSSQTVTITPGAAQCNSPNSGAWGGGLVPPTPTTPLPPAHPDGTLVLEGQTVYLIANGMRSGFRTPAEYLSYGYKFSQLVTSNATDNAKPFTSVLKAMEGTLVLDATDNRTVYMVGQAGSKRGFTSTAVFSKLGYGLAGLPKIDLSDYTAGAPIADAGLSHPEGSLVLDRKTVWWIRGNTRQGFESGAVFQTYGFMFDRVVKANAADLAMPVGPPVKLRDGTLVLDGQTYYIISDGEKLMFSSASDLLARGYKTSNAITANLSAYESGGLIP